MPHIGNNKHIDLIKSRKGIWKSVLRQDYSLLSLKGLVYRLKYLSSPIYEAESFMPLKGDILDLGCGEGIFCRFLDKVSSRRNVNGLDISQSRINYAKENSKNNIKFFCQHLHEVEEHSAYDAISIIHVLYLVPFGEQEKLFDDCKRLLRKNGKLVIIALDPESFFNSIVLPFIYNLLKPENVIIQLMSKLMNLSPEAIIGKRLKNPYYSSQNKYIVLLKENDFLLEETIHHTRWPFSYFILSFQKQ